MDLETENRIAAILMKEAAELRRQAASDGIDAYLRPPNVRGRPNSRFLTATVLGVQQSNRAVEVKEMWRAREKEKEMDDTVKKDEKQSTRGIRFYEMNRFSSCSSSKFANEDGLRDKEIEEFLHSRDKRGRGAIGSRMDDTAPYLPDSKRNKTHLASPNCDNDNRAVLGPEKPRNLKSDSSSDEQDSYENRKNKKRAKRVGSSKHHCRKHTSKEEKKKRSKHTK